MVVLSASGLGKNYGFKPILAGVTLALLENDRVAVVGPNGAGKTTLLRILARDERADAGLVTWRRGLTVGYAAQMPDVSDETLVHRVIDGAFGDVLALHRRVERLTEAISRTQNPREMEHLADDYDTALSRLIALDGYQVWSRVDGIVRGFGFDAEVLTMPFGQLSGGERTKVLLARALVAGPDVLILDEPTNHLDLPALHWLEEYLRRYDGAVMVVSHDRYFLDRVVNRVWEVDEGQVTCYAGTYSEFVAERERRLLLEFEAYKDQQVRVQHMESAVKRLRDWANRAHPPSEALHRRASSIQKALDRMVRLERPQLERPTMRLVLDHADRSGRDVVRLSALSKNYGERQVLENIDLSVEYGERLGIVGANGAGKSTLLRLILGQEAPDSGQVSIGSSVKLGFLSQHMWDEAANPHDRVIDRFRGVVPMEVGRARSHLARFLFFGDHVFRPVGSLSGGEQMRLRLAQLMPQEMNMLVLDEPTNHLDIESREVLEAELAEFPGTLIVVSHDRYFLNRRVSVICWLEDGHLDRYSGSYDAVMALRSMKGMR